MKTFRITLVVAAVVLAATALTRTAARADSVADFYRGKDVTVVVGYGPGGGYDLFARLLARHLGEFIPGKPKPTARELAPTAAARDLIAFTETQLLTMSRPFAAPPGIPADRAAALRTAFMAAHRDPQYIADATKIGVEISPVDADEVVAALNEMAHASPETFDYVRKLFVNKGD